MKYFAVLITVLSVVFCASGEEGGKGWLQLELKKTQVGIATVYYDPMFEEKLDLIKSTFKGFLAKCEAASALLAKKEAVVKDINELLGETDRYKEGQAAALEKFLALFKGVDNMTFFVVSGEKVKDFLRKGGTLPDCTYNKEDDTCSYRSGLKGNNSKESVTSFEFAMPITSEQEFEKQIAGFIKGLSQMSGTEIEGSAIHEVAEMTLQIRIKARNSYLRWFVDGTANVIAYELLKKHVSQEKADKFLSYHDIDKYKELTTEINLQYWMLLKYCVDGAEDELILPRYCFATHEMMWLVEKHGIGCIKEIVDEMCKHDKQTNELLVNVIKQVTGEDMTERFKKYQTFATRQEGMKKYVAKAQAAIKSKDAKEFLSNNLRMLELYDSPFKFESLMTRVTIAKLLFQTGQRELGDKTMNECVNFLNELKAEAAKLQAKQIYLAYAVETNRPEIAVSQAEEILKKHPERTGALGVKMIALAKKGKLQQAKPFAEKILKVAKKDDLFYGVAQKVIMLADKNKPKVIR